MADQRRFPPPRRADRWRAKLIYKLNALRAWVSYRVRDTTSPEV
jgi:hypothetical protein